MEFSKARALYPEKRGFLLDRPDSGDEYIFVHFLTPARIIEEDVVTEVSAGGCIIWDKHSSHCLSSPHCDLSHDWFHASGDVPEVLDRYGLSFGRVYYPTPDDFVTSYIQKIELELLQDAEFSREICSHRAEELFAMLARNVRDGSRGVGVDADTRRLFIKVRRQVHQDYARTWRVEDMSELAGFSESRFFTLYQEIFGISPKRDLVLLRLQHSRILLMHSGYTVERVAEEVGFSNVFHFLRSFKKEFGITPGKYKGTPDGGDI